MWNKSFGKKILIVAFGRMMSLISGVAVGFLLPKIFSVTEYGFYKVFTLYAVYTALLHFGFVDGILLKISGMDYKELDHIKMRAYTRFYVVFEICISLIMMLVGLLCTNGEYLFIVIMLAINMVFVNITTYYQFVSQAVQRFGEYSAKNLIISAVKLVFVLSLYFISNYYMVNISHRVYLMGLNILDLSIMLWYISMYRDITFGKRESIKKVKTDILSIFKTGILLTLAYQMSHLVLALDRQFVNLLFSTETFAIYSFAYNIVSMISTMVSSISIVLLPMLKNRTSEIVIGSYKKSLSTIAMIASGGLLCYFPLVLFIGWFLPEYYSSIQYMAIVLPAFLFSSVITVVMFTINKVFDMNFIFFKDSCFVFILGLLFNMLAYYLFKTPEAISYASIVVMMIWFLISGMRLKGKTSVGVRKEFIYLFLMAIGFLAITSSINIIWIGFVLYLALVLLGMLFFYKNMISIWHRN